MTTDSQRDKEDPRELDPLHALESFWVQVREFVNVMVAGASDVEPESEEHRNDRLSRLEIDDIDPAGFGYGVAYAYRRLDLKRLPGDQYELVKQAWRNFRRLCERCEAPVESRDFYGIRSPEADDPFLDALRTMTSRRIPIPLRGEDRQPVLFQVQKVVQGSEANTVSASAVKTSENTLAVGQPPLKLSERDKCTVQVWTPTGWVFVKLKTQEQHKVLRAALSAFGTPKGGLSKDQLIEKSGVSGAVGVYARMRSYPTISTVLTEKGERGRGSGADFAIVVPHASL